MAILSAVLLVSRRADTFTLCLPVGVKVAIRGTSLRRRSIVDNECRERLLIFERKPRVVCSGLIRDERSDFGRCCHVSLQRHMAKRRNKRFGFRLEINII